MSVRPAAVRTADGQLGAFWVQRERDHDRIWYARIDPDGVPQERVVVAETGQVTGPLAATRVGSRVVVVWTTRTSLGHVIRLSAIGPRGRPEVSLDVDVPGPGPGEAAVAAGPDGLAHVAWSRATEEGQEIRYRRWSAAGFLDAPRTVGRGDFPGVAVTGDAVHIVWWRFVSLTTVQLQHLRFPLRAGEPGPPQVLTGRLSVTGRFYAPVVVATSTGMHVAGTLVQGGLGRDVAQVFYLRLGEDGRIEVPRTNLLPQVRFASEPQLQPTASGDLVVIWTDRRGRTLQIRGGLLETDPPRIASESQISFSYADSIRPVLVGGAPRLAAIWLEVRGSDRFPVLFSWAPWAGTRRFVWGIPDLDLSRPAEAVLFAATAVIISLPVAALFLVPAAAGAGVVALLMRALGRGFAGSEWTPRPWLSGAVLFAAYVLLKLAMTRPFVYGGPAGPAIYAVAPAVATVVTAALLVRKPTQWGPDLMRLARGLLWAFIDLQVTVFPWIVGRLSRL